MGEIIVAFIGILGGSVGTLLFYKQRRRVEIATADTAEIENNVSHLSGYQKQVDFLNRQLETAFQQLGRLQQIINDNRDRIIELLDEVNHLKIVLKEESEMRESAQYYSCVTKNCDKREQASDKL